MNHNTFVSFEKIIVTVCKSMSAAQIPLTIPHFINKLKIATFLL